MCVLEPCYLMHELFITRCGIDPSSQWHTLTRHLRVTSAGLMRRVQYVRDYRLRYMRQHCFILMLAVHPLL